MPYAYLADPSLCFDAWMIRKLATNDFSHDRWSFEDYVDFGENKVTYHSVSTTVKASEIVDVEEPDGGDGLIFF